MPKWIIEKEKLEHELQVAQAIQESILPEILPQTETIHFGTFLKPARAVGGDFYDIFELDQHRIGIMIGDVTDKGVPSALVMAQTHALIYAEAMRKQSPQQVMEKVNQMVMRINQSGLFITAIYGILDLENNLFSYARAGHEIPLIKHHRQPSTLTPKSTGQPLGLLDDAVFDCQQVQFSPGIRLLLYTDGALDMHNTAGVQYGLSRLQKDFDTSDALSPQETCEFLYQKFAAHQEDTPQDDDITLILIQA
ncbi:MAG: PP2C family protein-serine/threonine phosphatase [Anaerolineales bacterium]